MPGAEEPTPTGSSSKSVATMFSRDWRHEESGWAEVIELIEGLDWEGCLRTPLLKKWFSGGFPLQRAGLVPMGRLILLRLQVAKATDVQYGLVCSL